MFHRIKKIISVRDYTIICEWTDGDIRAIQMENKLREWSHEPHSVYKKLLDKNIFSRVQLDPQSKTLCWEGLLQMRDTSGGTFSSSLDIDPDELYQMSTSINEKTGHDNLAA